MNWPSLLIGAAVGSAVTASLYALCRKPRRQPAVSIHLEHLRGGTMNLRLPVVGALALFVISGKDAKGNTAPLENITATLSPAELGTINIEGDELTVTPTGETGMARLQVTADGRIGEGEALLVADADIEFIAGQATFIELQGTVQEA